MNSPLFSNISNLLNRYIKSIKDLVSLASDVTEEEYGIKALIKFPPGSLLNPESNKVYYGSGRVLHSLYTVANKPQFTMPAVQQMIYKVTLARPWATLTDEH